MKDISKAIKLLDKNRPQWQQKIDLSLLDMSSAQNCILGQLYGDYSDGQHALKLGYEKCVALGFSPEGDEYDDGLQEIQSAFADYLRTYSAKR